MDLGLLVLHVVVGLLFVGHGAQKLFGVLDGYGIEGVGAFFETIGLRPGKLNAIAAGSAELLGGTLIALGLLVPLGAALIIAVMTAATLTAHKGKGLWNDKGGFELPLVNVAAVFALAAVGAGDVSLDAALDLDLASTGWALAALGVGVVGALAAVAQGRLHGRGVSSETQAQGV